MAKKIFLVAALIVLSFSLVSCQTIAGFGSDITWTAEATAELMEGN